MDTHIIEAPEQVNPLAVDQTISLKGYLNDRREPRGAARRRQGSRIQRIRAYRHRQYGDQGARRHPLPNILVIDLSGIDFELAAMEALANVCEPNVRVIAVGERNDIFLYRRLKSIGVAEYLYKPVTQEYFEQALREVTGRASQRPKARLGKLGLPLSGPAVASAPPRWRSISPLTCPPSARRRVALLDLDLFSETTSLLLNTVPNAALCEALDNPERVDHKFLERAMLQVSERLDVLGSDGEKMPVNGLTPEGVRHGDGASSVALSLHGRGHSDIRRISQSRTPGQRRHGLRGLRRSAGQCAQRRRLIRSLTPSCSTVHTVLNRAGAPGQISMAEIEKVLGRRPGSGRSVPAETLRQRRNTGNSRHLRQPPREGGDGRLAREVSGQEPPRTSFLDRIFRR